MTERSGRPVLEVQLRARANSRPICSGCKRTRPGYDVLSVRRYQFVPFWGILVFFLYARRRVDCPTCGVKAEGLEPVLKGSRWWFLKRPGRLTARQAGKLKEVLKYNLKTVRSYLLKEGFQFFWDDAGPYWAGRFLDTWCRRVMRSRIEPMQKVAGSLRSHRELILNGFRAQKEISAGVVEGLNNKAKLATRKAYGFRTYDALEIVLYPTLGDLPEPEHAHAFS